MTCAIDFVGSAFGDLCLYEHVSLLCTVCVVHTALLCEHVSSFCTVCRVHTAPLFEHCRLFLHCLHGSHCFVYVNMSPPSTLSAGFTLFVYVNIAASFYIVCRVHTAPLCEYCRLFLHCLQGSHCSSM